MKIKELVTFLDQRYSVHVHDEIDQGKLGLQIGSLEDELTSVLLTLDVTFEVVEEAIKLGSNFIITHHPVVFVPLLRITDQSSTTKLVRTLIQSNINVYSMHTNLDLSVGGVNDALANLLGLSNVMRISTGVPQNDFLRYGTIQEQTLYQYANFIKQTCNIPFVKVIGNPKKLISTVAILGGAGSDIEYQNQAKTVQADVYVTSEIKHHEALYANLAGLAMIEIPHSMEFSYVNLVKQELSQFGIVVHQTKTMMDPFIYL